MFVVSVDKINGWRAAQAERLKGHPLPPWLRRYRDEARRTGF